MALSRARVVEGMRRINQRLKDDWGLDVREVPGWENRGSGNFQAVRYVVNHHDAFPASSGHDGGLRTVTFGRPDLRNSLCAYYLSSRPTVWTVAAGVSWHTGAAEWRGSKVTNSRALGIEARNNGVGEPWSDAMQHAYLALDYEIQVEFGVDLINVVDHKEIAVPRGRKVDRFGINPSNWRAKLALISPRSADEEVKPRDVFKFIQAPGHPVLLANIEDREAVAVPSHDARLGTAEVWGLDPDVRQVSPEVVRLFKVHQPAAAK